MMPNIMAPNMTTVIIPASLVLSWSSLLIPLMVCGLLSTTVVRADETLHSPPVTNNLKETDYFAIFHFQVHSFSNCKYHENLHFACPSFRATRGKEVLEQLGCTRFSVISNFPAFVFNLFHT